MGTEYINQGGLKRVEFYQFSKQIHVGPGELSLKGGAYKYGRAFISFDSKNEGYTAFAYLSIEQLKVLRDQINSLVTGKGGGVPIDGWFDEGYGTGADGPERSKDDEELADDDDNC
tara:strand:- start:75 stop:422 length:348 start_codon:yes stop_codon:yes gene_type:complete